MTRDSKVALGELADVGHDPAEGTIGGLYVYVYRYLCVARSLLREAVVLLVGTVGGLYAYVYSKLPMTMSYHATCKLVRDVQACSPGDGAFVHTTLTIL